MCGLCFYVKYLLREAASFLAVTLIFEVVTLIFMWIIVVRCYFVVSDETWTVIFCLLSLKFMQIPDDAKLSFYDNTFSVVS